VTRSARAVAAACAATGDSADHVRGHRVADLETNEQLWRFAL